MERKQYREGQIWGDPTRHTTWRRVIVTYADGSLRYDSFGDFPSYCYAGKWQVWLDQPEIILIDDCFTDLPQKDNSALIVEGL